MVCKNLTGMMAFTHHGRRGLTPRADLLPIMRPFIAMVLLAVFGFAAAPAAAQTQPPDPDGVGTDYFVTIAARVCPKYTDISANKSRNNIQESLENLGPNTKYTSGQLVNPAQELAMQPEPPCEELPGWRFMLGRGIAADPVTGVWGSLSVVSGNDPTNITTQAQVWDRNSNGKQITDGTKPPIEGATAIELTEEQKTAAINHNLWIQGGTQTDPVLNGPFPNGYGFGALRCATDNVNGDNVEYIQFASVKHVYCYAYYVKPPPPSGTIIIRKELAPGTPKLTQSFTFRGNISYTPGQDFSLTTNADPPADSITFYRAASTPTVPATLWNGRRGGARGLATDRHRL